MAAIIPAEWSAELSQVPPIGQTYSPLKPSQFHGRVRMAYFTKAIAAELIAVSIGLCNIPKNARILRGYVFIGGGPGANVNFDIGLIGRDGKGFIDATPGATIADNANYLGNFAPANAAAAGNFASTVATNVGYLATRDLQLIATVRTANVSVAQTLQGYVEYVVD